MQRLPHDRRCLLRMHASVCAARGCRLGCLPARRSLSNASTVPFAAGLLEGLKAFRATKPFDLALSIGGWAEGSERFSGMAANPAMRKTFIESVIKCQVRTPLLRSGCLVSVT